MPNATIYIRKEDVKKWDAIKKPSEWIHQQLNPVPAYEPDIIVTIPKPPELSDLRWMQHLKDSGIDPNAELFE